MQSSPDIAIIGGGIIGLTTAYYLAREGCRVLVLDKGDLGHEASWAGAGIIPACDPATAKTPLDQLRAFSCQQFPSLSQELLECTGIDNGYRRCGGLEFVDLGEPGHEDEWQTEASPGVTLTNRELAEIEPGAANDLGRAVHLADMAQVRNPRHLRAMQGACQSLGVSLRPQCAVHGLQQDGMRITGLQTPEGVVHAGRFLIAAGAWSEELLDSVGWRPGIRPIRGQIVLLKAMALRFQRILLAGSRYVVPRGDGYVVVGSTEEDVGFEKRNTAIAVKELLALACRLAPGLREATMERCWSGLRPGSPDGLPFLGLVPGWDNLFVAAGHFRSGILLSPGTGLVMKELLLGQSPTVALKGFHLDRASAR
ncbi:MAG TPA: glycine oxidase ThiO [Gemmataceae bacterium]|nr:glycine oxidase ThiO [Gemmataceae bacterium]